MENRVQYIIDLVVQDKKLRQKMAQLNWEDLIGSNGKDLSDLFGSEAEDAVKKLKTIFHGLNIDWSKILGAKDLGRLEQQMAKVLSSSKKQISAFATMDDTSGIQRTVEYVAELGNQLKSLGSNFDAAQLARGMGAFMKVLAPLSAKIDTLAKEPAKVEAAFDRLFNNKTLNSADQTINKIATAMATLGINKSVVTNMKQVRSEMDKLVKSAKPIKLDIDYGSLEDADLLSILQKKYKNQTTDLSKLLGYEWGNLTMNMPDITDAEKTKKHLLAILELEKKIISIDGKSPVDEFFADDTGFDSIKELRREFERLTKTAEESVKETVNTLEKGVKTIQQSITEKLGKLAEVKIDLTLDETNKTQFKNSIDTFVSDLNSNKYGEINSVKVDLDLNEPTKTTNRGRPKSTSKEQIEATKANIQNALNVAEEERNKANSLLADLNERHSKELEKNKNYDNEPQSARLKGSINKAEEELKSLEKTIISYNYLLSQMDDYEFAKSVVSDWKKFSSAAQNIRISQDKLLSDTRKWRAEMNDALKFRYQWKVDGTADEFDRLSYALTSMSEENPIKLMPDIDFIANAIEEGLAGREINVKLAADSPIKATGGIVGNLGVVPIVSSTNKSTTQDASLSPKPVSVTQPQPSKQETVKSQSHVYVDTDVDAIIKYVEDQVNSNRELNDSYLKLLKSVGITDKEVSSYIKKVRNKEIEIPKEVVRQYGSENTFLKRLEKTKESVNFNEKLPFYDVANDILKLKNTIDNNPDDEIKIRNASEQIKSLLIKSVVDSFKLYIQKSKERFEKNEEEIKKQTDIKNAARKAYESDSEKKKRLNAIDSQKQKVAELESNSAITEYETLLQLIEDAKKEGDKDVINSFLKQEQETLPSVKQGYQDLIKARQKLKELEKEDPNDPNLLKIIEADKRIASLKRSNEKIIRSRQAYENIGFPLNQLEELINTGDNNAIYDLVIDKILNKSDIVQSMGYKRKESSATDAIYLFDTMAQKLMTKTIEMVQQAIGIAQKTTEELNRRVINENMLNDLRGIASKKKVLSSIYNWGSEPQSSEVFEKINSLFADELEDARQMGESGATTDREKAYVNFANALDSATKAADGFRAIYDSWSDSEKQSFKDSSNKEEWFKKKYNNPAEANKNYLAYTKNDAAVKTLINSIQYKKPNAETGEPEQYGIYKEITNQLKGYVFRVTLVDDKGSHIVDVGTDNLVKLGKLSKPDKWYNPGSLNETNFLIGDPYSDYKLPEDLSEISDIKVYNTPSGKRSYDQPRNTETPSAQSTNKKTSVSSSVSEAKRLISNAKRTVDEAENTVSLQKILESSNEILESAVQTQEIINNQIDSITGGVDVKEYREHLIQKRDSLKEIRNGEKELNSTSIDPLNNKAFDEANEIIDNAIRKADIARQIAKNPFNIETHSLFEGELPDALKRLLDISQQQKDLKNTLPANQQEAVEAQNKIRALQEETKTLVPLINQWADNVINQSDKVVADANKIKEQAAPKLAKDYQKKLTELVNQAMSLSQQIEANPNNEELKNQMQSVIDNIYKLTPLYKKLLDKYNITTKGFLGNENQKKLDIAQKIYENPTKQNLWSEFGKVPDAVKRASELIQRDSELTRLIPTLPDDQRRLMELERLNIAKEYEKEHEKILQWVKKQQIISSTTGIFAGLGNSGQKFKNAQNIIANWNSDTKSQTFQTVDADQEINKLNTEISQLNALERQAETQAQIVENARERVNLATRQLEIEKELANTSITAERKAELEAEYDKNKIRATELGIKSRKFITTSVDADELQNAYLTVVDDLIDQQEESDKKVSKLRSDIAKEQQRLGRLEAERTPEAVAEGKRHTQDSVIKSAISYMASELANTNPEIYSQLREEAKSEHPLTDFYDYQNPYERQERAIQEAISKKAKEYVKIMMTPEEEQKIINESIVAQKKAIEAKETELQAEIARNNEIVAAREQYKLEGKITNEMIAARRNATEEIRREAQIVSQSTEAAAETASTIGGLNSEPSITDEDNVGYDTHYQNYTSGQMYRYGAETYSINIPGVATEDTLYAIYQLLSGDASERGLSDAEKKALEAELAAIRAQRGDGSLSRNEPQYGTPERELFERRQLAAKLGIEYLDLASVKYTEVDSTLVDNLKDKAEHIFKIIEKSNLELLDTDKINELQRQYTQIKDSDKTTVLAKQLYDLISEVFRYLKHSGVDVENSSYVQEKSAQWGIDTSHINDESEQTDESAKQLKNAKAETIETEKQLKMFSAWARLQGDEDAKWQQMDGEAESAEAWAKKLRASGYTVGFVASEEDWDAEAEKYNQKIVERREKQRINSKVRRDIKKFDKEHPTAAAVVAESKEVSESLMTVGKAITIINKAIGGSTAKTTTGMAKAYANKIHGNTEIVEAAKFLYNTPDSKITTKYGKSVKTKLKNFRDAWASNQQGVKESTQPIEENSDYKKAVEIVRNAIGDFKGRSDAKNAEKYNSLGQEVKDAGNLIYNNLANATKEEKALFDKLKRLRDAAKKIEGQVVTPSIENVNGAQVDNEIIHKTLPDGSPWEGTKQEWDEFNAWLSGESIEVDVKPTVQPGAVEQAIDESIANNPPDASIVKADFVDGTHFEGTKEELQEIITMLGDPIAQTIEASKQQIKNEQAKTAETIKQVENEKTETVEGNNQLNNIESLKAREAEINAKLLADDKLKATQSVDKTASGGIIGAMNELAKDNTLHQILEAIGEIAKRQVSRASGKGNSAQDLLMRLEGLRDLSVGQDKERIVYMDLNTGAITDSVEGQRDGVIYDTLDLLRKVYQGKIDLNAQVHTHGKSDNPDDQYFSEKDFATFKSSFDKGIKTQILVSEQGLTVLDLSSVEKLSEDTLTKFGGGKSAYDALLGNDLGVKYVTQTWNSLVSNPDLLVKLLGIKGIESKYTKEETRDSAVSGVLVEDAKEAADVLQESTGRAIKKTVERVGAELMTITEKTDAKGNKTWSNQINNKYEKAALATNKAFEKLGLANQFGEGTEAQIALDNYNDEYSKFIDLVNRFKQNPKQDGLQEEFNKLLPELDEAETKLNKLIIAKNKFIGNKEPITIFTQDQVGTAGNSLKKVAIEQFAGISDNMAFNGISETPNGTRLLVDVLKDGFISQYAIEVDKATGQVREFMMAETALVNAFQNVNKAMKQNESVMANIVPTDVTSSEQLQDFLNNANSPMWDAYKFALADMEKYTLDLLISMKDGKNVSKEQEDYLMSLSEKVIRLGKDVQKTSGAFNNFWAQNPDSVSNLNFSYDPNNRDEKVRSELEKEAIKRANRENSEYKFLSFDNDTLQYELTDLEGNITKVTLVWNELYKQVATVSNKSVGAIDPVVAKIQKYEEALRQATDNKYLRDDDASLKGFTDSLNNIEWLIQGIKDGTETFETAKEKLVQYRQEALKFGQDALKIAKANEKLYTGTSELRSASRQRDKIIGMFGEDFDESDLPSIQQYKKEYQGLIDLYNGLNEKKKLYDTNEQEGLRQRAVRVQAIGSQLLTSIKQAEKLQQLVDESGTYKDVRGNDIKLGGKQSLSEQINNVQDLKTTMLDYVQNGLKIADLEHVKFSNRTKQLTAEVRTSKDTVAEIVVEYNKATNALYAYNLQEKESLTGIRGVIQGFKSKLHSILQYTASITSIYRVFGELKRGIQYVKEIDSALTELKKVTDETEATYDKFLNTAAKTADKVGSTIKEVVSSTADWARLGYSLEDAANLAESTSVLLNVSEFQSIDDATSALVSTMQAFGYAAEDSMHVVDVMNEIGNNYAVSSDGIATALQDSASSLMAANNSYQEAVSLIAAANRVVILRHGL